MLRVDPEPFESPFDSLTVLSDVEGLTAPSKIEGENRAATLLTPLFQAGLERCRRVNLSHEMPDTYQTSLWA